MIIASYQKLLMNGDGILQGSAQLPSISRTSDPDTGIFFPNDNTVGITTGGVERVRFGEFIEFRADGRTVLPAEIAPVAAGSQTINCAATSIVLKVGGNATITLANMAEGQTLSVLIASPGSAYTITWAGETFLWSGAAVPTPTATGGRVDFYTFQKLAGVVFAGASLNHG